MIDFFSFKTFLKKEYPHAFSFLQTHSYQPIFFPEQVHLPLKNYRQIQQVIASLFQLKCRANYQKSLSLKAEQSFNQNQLKTALKSQNLDSVLMAYDFHLHEGEVKLIEVNTNGSGFLLFNSFCQFQNQPYKKSIDSLKKSFQSEWDKFRKGQKSSQPKKTVLIDEDPLNQKMALEFFMFKDFFESMGWPFEICDSRSLKTDDKGFLYTSEGHLIDFVYNRSVDFYFEQHPQIAKAYLKGTCAISPHPREYFLLSDKSRLCDWFQEKQSWEELKTISKHIPYSEALDSKNKGAVWENRKKYFFKVKQSHGGKRAYRGASLTRKKLEEFFLIKALVQEFIPPSVIEDSQGVKWKTDFRAYAYEDQIQQVTARCYQGQITNFKKEGSGFAIIKALPHHLQ